MRLILWLLAGLLGVSTLGIVALLAISYGVGGTVLAVLLYRSRLIPRGIAVLGLIGYPALLVGTVLAIFGATDVTQGAGLLAVVPGALFEFILPIWLITRGSCRSNVGEEPSKSWSSRARELQLT